ncbi:MAG: cytochrome C oxidase subunit IV family protein [Ignavibacteria bacterium]|nr:cytochrome C oxidase subunit IV family protein [Ignavibacteria bacterium]MBL7990013.1 cytochrome C oxidase subunit IV family protein [Candidatus Kapabacteria bacterium]
MGAGLSAEEMQKSYLKIFGALMVFTLLTIIAAKFVHFPESWGGLSTTLHVTIGLIIAVAKAWMVVYVFMHIKFDNPYIRVFIYIPLFLFSVLVFALTVLGGPTL